MTHEELLAEVKKIWMGEKPDGYAVMALKAVVELHKPRKLGDEVACGLCCYERGDAIDSYLLRQNYPCSTIQAIEKELA